MISKPAYNTESSIVATHSDTPAPLRPRCCASTGLRYAHGRGRAGVAVFRVSDCFQMPRSSADRSETRVVGQRPARRRQTSAALPLAAGTRVTPTQSAVQRVPEPRTPGPSPSSHRKTALAPPGSVDARRSVVDRRASVVHGAPSRADRRASGAHGGRSVVDGGRSGAHGGRSVVDGGRSRVHGGRSVVDGGRSGVHGGRSRADGRRSVVDGGRSGADRRPSVVHRGPSGADRRPSTTHGAPSGTDGGPSRADRAPPPTGPTPRATSENLPNAGDGATLLANARSTRSMHGTRTRVRERPLCSSSAKLR